MNACVFMPMFGVFVYELWGVGAVRACIVNCVHALLIVCVCVHVLSVVCVCACVECCLRVQEMLLSASSTVRACSPQTLHSSYDRNLTPDRSSTLQDEIIRRSMHNRQLQRLMSTAGSRCLERAASSTDKDAQIALERGAGGSSKLKSASKQAVSMDLGTILVAYRWVGGVVVVVVLVVCVCVCMRVCVCVHAYVCMGLSV